MRQKKEKKEVYKYLAHMNEAGQEQTLAEHLKNTANRAGCYASVFGAEKLGFCAGMLHDIGKYSEKFQQRLRGKEEKVDHATAGAQICWEKKGLYTMISYCIAGHHTGLLDTGALGDTGADRSMYGRLRKRLEDYSAYAKEIQIPEAVPPTFQPVKGENLGFFFSMLTRMLYSCLVDADFLDTEHFMQGGMTERDGGEPLEILFDRLKTHISGWLDNDDLNTINGRRTEILKHCLAMGSEERGLFLLTVPTGGGKTVASLAFALKHAVEHGMKRVIYVIPYTSIIEQNAKVFVGILGERNVLENHCSVDYEASEELKPMQLAAENWDKPVVVTTNVQFFESLFSNKSSKCRKLHNIADSVIIFDEAQMLPVEYLKPCLAAMEQLVRYYKSTLVLCTATQPALKTLFAEDLKHAKELCPRREDQFAFFKRTQIRDMGQLSAEELAGELQEQNSVLCILNTKKTAQKMYKMLDGEGTFHLSTSMYPAHRKRVLEEIRRRLRSGERCVVVSTSLVEAGVDLDFQTVYRQLTGVDSVIQAAGRCNREGRRTLEASNTWVFRLAEREYTPGQRRQMEITEKLLDEGMQIEALETVQEYFTRLYYMRRESLDQKDILGYFNAKGYYRFEQAAKVFQLISDDTAAILIPREESAKQLAEEWKRMGPSRARMREAGKFSVNVYKTDLEKLQAAGMVSQISADVEDFYLLTEESSYDEKLGLRLDIELGRAVIF